MKARWQGPFGKSEFVSSTLRPSDRPWGWTQRPPAPKGWECPKCGAVYAPSFPQCTNCKPRKDDER